MKLFSVQYLRGLAALLVVLTHAIAHPSSSRDPMVVRLGGLGITIFFVISGFIMVLVSGTGPFDRWRFYLRRIQRLVPLYWIATVCIAIVAAIAPSLLKTTRFSWSEFVLSLFFVPHYRSNGELVPILKLGWTLNLEMFFYFCFGLFAPLRLIARVAILTTVLCSLSLAGQIVHFDNPLLASYTSLHFVSFSVGMWLGVAQLSGKVPRPRATPALATAGAAFLVVSLFVPGSYPSPAPVGTAAIGAACLLCAGLVAEDTLFKSRLATLLGDASYAIYLVHIYFVAVAVVLWRRYAPDLPLPLVIAGAFLSGTSAGIAVHFAVERPFMRLFSKRSPHPRNTDGGIVLPDGVPPALVSAAEPAGGTSHS